MQHNPKINVWIIMKLRERDIPKCLYNAWIEIENMINPISNFNYNKKYLKISHNKFPQFLGFQIIPNSSLVEKITKSERVSTLNDIWGLFDEITNLPLCINKHCCVWTSLIAFGTPAITMSPLRSLTLIIQDWPQLQ